MKTKKTYQNFIVSLIIAFCLIACEDMMDIHKKYVEGGEITYAPKLDSVQFLAGNNRILFQFWLKSAPNVRTVNLYWNSHADSLIIPVTPSAGLDSLSVFIENLEEQTYTFDALTTDIYGYSSLISSGISTSYGNIFQSTLNPRQINRILISSMEGTVSWYSSPVNLLATEVRYTDTNGEIQIIQTPANESSTICPQADPASTFEYRSLFLPEPVAVDTFYVDWVEKSWLN
jgi:hypothetical protein